MTDATFKSQIVRLQTQWPNSYGEERLKRLWKLYERVSDNLFSEIVDEAIDTCRAAPLVEDFGKLEQDVEKRRAQQRYGSQPQGFGQILNDAARNNKTADPEFVKACTKLFSDFQSGRLTKKQFFEGCDMLDQVANRLSPPTSRTVSKPRETALPYRDD